MEKIDLRAPIVGLWGTHRSIGFLDACCRAHCEMFDVGIGQIREVHQTGEDSHFFVYNALGGGRKFIFAREPDGKN